MSELKKVRLVGENGNSMDVETLKKWGKSSMMNPDIQRGATETDVKNADSVSSAAMGCATALGLPSSVADMAAAVAIGTLVANQRTK